MTTPTAPPDLAAVVPPIRTSPSLPSNFTHTHPPPQLIAQGAEALLYHTTYLLPSTPSALKYRPSKPYRHPTLDARLTRHRILSEARVLVKCRREGVCVPAVYALDWEKGWLMMEWVEGGTVRGVLDDWLKPMLGGKEEEEGKESTEGREEELRGLMERVGEAVGKMHEVGVVHGDLTTSNLMLRPPADSSPEDNYCAGAGAGAETTGSRRNLEGDIVLIDFGLAAQSVQDEDKAVDLYVLERAFGSTHPKAEGLFKEVIKVYGQSYKGAGVVLKKLEEVRMRGRKKSMLG
ncbi:MAG: serine/threonine-protein kinase bud32 [Pycnora praestabilis]|nr:MAG: serine/threonine-protein kinase bud32 [Pycnora praestabilis]